MKRNRDDAGLVDGEVFERDVDLVHASVASCLDGVPGCWVRVSERVAVLVVLVERDAELGCSGEYDVQVFSSVGEERETDRRGELGVEVLVCVCWVQTDVAVAVFDGEVFAWAVPIAQVVVDAVLEGVDYEGVVGEG